MDDDAEPLVALGTEPERDEAPSPEPAGGSASSTSSQWRFHPIAPSRAHESVVEQITFAIRAGAFAPGERLPHIEALSRAMHVSKPVVGEALKLLSRTGVLRVQRGMNGGVTVLTREIPRDLMTPATDHLSIADIVEARRPVELALALLAGERATNADFAMLEACIERQIAHRDADLERRIRFDHLFHYNIGRAARSQELAIFQHRLLEQLLLRLRSYFQEIEDVDGVIDLHLDTLDALRSRDRARIEQAIDRHLLPLEQAVADRLTGEEPQNSRGGSSPP